MKHVCCSSYHLAKALAVLLALQSNVKPIATTDGNSESGRPNDNTGNEESGTTWPVDVSPECAAVMIFGSTAASGVASWVLIQAALPLVSSAWCGASSGFCAAGIKTGSLASWWQSTMPLVAKGGIFSSLQSIAMSSTVGSSATASTVLIGSSLGGAMGASYLKEICSWVDEAAAEGRATKRGTAVLSIHDVVKTGDYVYKQAGEAVEYMTPHIESAAEYVKENLPHAMKAAEDGVAGAWGFLVKSFKGAKDVATEMAEGFEQKWREAMEESERHGNEEL